MRDNQQYVETWCLNCGKRYTANSMTESTVFCNDACFREYHDLARDKDLDIMNR